MKGVLPIDEIAALPPAWALVEAFPLQVTELDAIRHLLLLRRAAHACSADAEADLACHPASLPAVITYLTQQR